MLEVPLQLAIRLHAEAPSVTGYPSACWSSVCRYDPSRVGLEWEGRHAVCWFPDSFAVDTEDGDSGGGHGDSDANWDVD